MLGKSRTKDSSGEKLTRAVEATALPSESLKFEAGKGRRQLGLASHFLLTVFHRGLAGEADAAFFIHAQAFDPDFIAHLDDVFGLLDAEIREFADVDQAIPAGDEFHKRTEFLDRHDLAAINLADLCFSRHAFDG